MTLQPSEPGWYVLCPIGWVGPYTSSIEARHAVPSGQAWPVRYFAGVIR
jgi:hypothetical protein